MIDLQHLIDRNRADALQTNRREWLDALLSGDYKQAWEVLRTHPGIEQVGHCCLGVLCDLIDPHGWSEDNYAHTFGMVSQMPTVDGLEYLDLTRMDAKKLMELNDGHEHSFRDIAHYQAGKWGMSL